MQEDLLGREPFVNLVEKIIEQKTNEHEGFSFAIDGKWGCGKSWVLKRIIQKLEAKKYFVIHYNCWENEYYDEPLVAILSVIVDKLNECQSATRIKKNKDIFKNAANFLLKVTSIILKEKLGIDVPEIIKAGEEAIDADKLPAIPTLFDKNQEIKITLKLVHDYLLKLKDQLSDFKYKNVVFIVDELDRCLPEYAIKVMQRLHYICFDSESDNYVFIQLAGLNKNELLGSIAKTFGREFNLTQKYTPPKEKEPGSIYYNNFEDSQVAFANYYFKKFFQMIIPVSNGNAGEESYSLLDPFEKYFNSEDNSGKELAKSLLIEVLSCLPMRTKLELIHLVFTAHQITILENSLRRKFSYSVLCVEFLYALCRSVFKKKAPVVAQTPFTQRHASSTLCLQIPDLTQNDQFEEVGQFIKALERWSNARYGAVRKNPRTERETYALIHSPISYVIHFFEWESAFFLDIKGLPAYAESEEKFISNFLETLSRLT